MISRDILCLLTVFILVSDIAEGQYGYGSLCRPYGMYGRGLGGMGMSGYGLYLKSYKKRGESTGREKDIKLSSLSLFMSPILGRSGVASISANQDNRKNRQARRRAPV